MQGASDVHAAQVAYRGGACYSKAGCSGGLRSGKICELFGDELIKGFWCGWSSERVGELSFIMRSNEYITTLPC